MRSKVDDRIAAFEQAAADAVNPEIMASKISFKSDRKKYDFCSGLLRDLKATRAALRQCASGQDDGDNARRLRTTFRELYDFTGGQIANLNRVLQNLKKAKEISFGPECFFVGVNDEETIQLLDKFWEEEYTVDAENVFRPGRCGRSGTIAQNERKGRSYVEENRITVELRRCAVCNEAVDAKERMAVREQVYHLRCLTCVVCGSSPRRKMDYLTFDGQICCCSDCVRRYDGAHLQQKRT